MVGRPRNRRASTKKSKSAAASPAAGKDGRKKAPSGRRKAAARAPAKDRMTRLTSLAVRLAQLSLPANYEKPPLLFLKSIVDDYGSCGAELAEVAIATEPKESARNAMLLLFVASTDRGVPPAVRRAIQVGARPVIHRALKDKGIEDERKLELGPLLAALGRTVDREEYRGFFRDFDRAVERMSRASAESVPDSLACVRTCLTEANLTDTLKSGVPSSTSIERGLEFGIQLGQTNAAVGSMVMGVAALYASARPKTAPLFERGVALIAETRSARARWVLEEMAVWAGLGARRDAPRAAAKALQEAGVEADAPHTGTFSHGYVTSVDGDGSQSMMLQYRTLEGAMDAVMLLLKDESGVHDAWCLFGEGAGIENRMRRFFGEGVTFAPLTPPQARSFVQHALSLHQAHERPVRGDFLICRPFFGFAALEPKAREPDLGAYMLETYVRGPELAIGSEEAAEDPVFGSLLFTTDRAYRFVLANMPHAETRVQRRWVAGKDARERFLVEVVVPERDALLRRLAANLEISAMAGLARTAAVRTAARTYLALAEGIVPMEELRYVREISRRSLNLVADNILLGFHSQHEANEARTLLDRAAYDAAQQGDHAWTS